MNKHIIKELNTFAIPLLIQMLSAYFIGATDVAIVGHLSIEALNATSLITSSFETIAGIFGAITITLNILLGKSLGKQDSQAFSFEFYTSILLSIFLGLCCSMLIFFFGKHMLITLFALDGNTLYYAMEYLKPMAFYFVFQLVIFAFTSSFKVLNRTKYILYISTFTSIIDVSLDYLFLFGKFGLPKMGVSFVGFSTIFTMACSIATYAYFLRRQVTLVWDSFGTYMKNMWQHIRMSIDLILQEIIDGSVYGLLVHMILIRLGTQNYAAYIIIHTIIGLLFLFKYVYGSAVLSKISIEGQRWNDVSPKRMHLLKYPKYASILALSLYLITAVFLLIWDTSILRLFSDNIDAIQIAKTYLLPFILIHTISCISYSYKLGLQAMNQTGFVLYASLVLDILAISALFVSVILWNAAFWGLLFTTFVIELLATGVFVRKYVKDVYLKSL